MNKEVTKVYLDVYRKENVRYIEDCYSSRDIIDTDSCDFAVLIKKFGKEIHSCYSPFINHIGRFHRYENGFEWFGEDMKIYRVTDIFDKNCNDYVEVKFDEKGRLIDWPFGFFG